MIMKNLVNDFDGDDSIKDVKGVALKVEESKTVVNENTTTEQLIQMMKNTPITNALTIKITTKLLLVVVLFSLVVGFSLGSMYTTITYLKQGNQVEKHIENIKESKSTEVKILEDNSIALNKSIEQKDILISNKQKEIDNLTKSLDSKNQEISSLNSELIIFKEREELYDKYEIAVMNTNGKRTDLTYEDIKYAEELSLSKGIPPKLIFYMMKLESNFNPKLQSSQSSARGLLQVIKGTGEYTHTKLLNKSKSTYNHDEMFDPKKNMEYAITYIDYTFDRSNGSVYEAMKRYSGGYSEFGIGDRYHQLVEGHMKKFGYSLQKAQEEYNKLNS